MQADAGPESAKSPPPPGAVARAGSLLLGALALFGAILVWDGGVRGDLRHRLVALGTGALFILPFTLARVAGERGRRWLCRAGLFLLGGALGLGLAELGVRLAGAKAFRPEELVLDPDLGHRMLPDRGEYDAWGFPNPRVPKRAEILCLGDSQTQGVSVAGRDAWPRELARRTGREVYSAALGGYGPLQYVLLLERGLSLEPQVAVVAFYYGNDLADAFTFAGLERWAEWRSPTVQYAPALGRRPDPRSANLSLALLDGALARSRVLHWLGERLRRRMKQAAVLDALLSAEQEEPLPGLGGIATRLTPDYRFEVLDLERPWIRDGLRLTGLALERMARIADRADVRLVLFPLPTKERCYGELLRERGERLSPALERLLRAELEVAGILRARALELGIEWVDPAPGLLAALRSGQALWPPGADGHFDRAGNRELARLLAEALGE